MGPTRIGTLLGAGLVAAPLGWAFGLVAQAATGALPAVPWVLPLLLLFMAALLLIGARMVRGWVEERRYDRQVDALLVARLFALGKAAAVFGAVIGGVYIGFGLLAAVELPPPVRTGRVVLSGLVVAGGVVVALSALRLERACRVPHPDGDDPDGPDDPDAGPGPRH